MENLVKLDLNELKDLLKKETKDYMGIVNDNTRFSELRECGMKISTLLKLIYTRGKA